MLCSQWLVTGVTGNDVRGAAGWHALNGSQIKRRVNQLSMMLRLGRITRFDSLYKSFWVVVSQSVSSFWVVAQSVSILLFLSVSPSALDLF